MQYRRGDHREQQPIIQGQQAMQDTSHIDGEDSVGRGGQYGFKARMFPLIGFIVAIFSIGGAYYVARSQSPPDVPPFPVTDITHTGLKFPEYTFLRIGLMVAAPLIAICFQSLKY